MQQIFDSLRLHSQAELNAKDTEMQLRFIVDQIKDFPIVDELIKEALEINLFLSNQKSIFRGSY